MIYFLLDWAPIHHIYAKNSQEEKERMNILVITHGVTGGSETNYIRHAVLKAMKNGYRVVVFNNRGVAGSPLKVIRIKFDDFLNFPTLTKHRHLNITALDLWKT